MDGLRQWALCLIVSAAAVTLAVVITPRGSTDKTVRAVAGIFVVSAIFTPLADMSFDFAAVSATEYADVQSDDLNDSLLDACRNAAENAILSSAAEQGITVEEICISADINSDGCIIIHGVSVRISSSDAGVIKRLSEIFGNAVGVPVEVNAE